VSVTFDVGDALAFSTDGQLLKNSMLAP